jgi:hypothetical protein
MLGAQYDMPMHVLSFIKTLTVGKKHFTALSFFYEFISLKFLTLIDHCDCWSICEIVGLILVYDLSNIKTFHHLKNWFKEVQKALNNKNKNKEIQTSKTKIRRFTSKASTFLKENETFFQYYHKNASEFTLPVLIIGNKADLINDKQVLVLIKSYNVFKRNAVNH